MNARHFAWIIPALAFALVFFATTSPALADPTSVDHGGTYVGSVVVEPGQVVDGDIDVVLGDATIEGMVNGDVNVLGGSVDNRGNVTGKIHEVPGGFVQTIVPWAPSGESYGGYASDHHLLWPITWDLIALVVFLIFPVRARMALARLEQHPAISTLAGLCGWVATFPIAVLLLFTIVLIPLIPVEFVLLAVAVFLGKAALALLVGRRFYELLQPNDDPLAAGRAGHWARADDGRRTRAGTRRHGDALRHARRSGCRAPDLRSRLERARNRRRPAARRYRRTAHAPRLI